MQTVRPEKYTYVQTIWILSHSPEHLDVFRREFFLKVILYHLKPPRPFFPIPRSIFIEITVTVLTYFTKSLFTLEYYVLLLSLQVEIL